MEQLKRIACRLSIIVAMSQTGSASLAADPPLPAGTDPGGVAVALIDTGLNYTLEAIAGRLARDAAGRLLGYDFQDDDRLPFDLAPGASETGGRRHGTSVASVLVREAPGARLVPFRFRAGATGVFAEIVERIAEGPARIVAMPLGGYRKADWEPFRKAAMARPEILFVLSAGNDGRNIDERPVYPAAFDLPNALVVTSTDSFGRLPRDSNWGARAVDVSTPAEGIEAVDHLGRPIRVSGSSYAVPRISALAARLKAGNPEWSGARLRRAILRLAIPSPGDPARRTAHGWIANPALY